ncbi:unnamed protein product [Tuber aestivum]|uniref:C2H2-type domain-containing protein n=1 Tax=Tuber aestivum TaxID=59557 RepID=A0A292PNW3_9PEZI|nr:unnamed protein product [Tuber aestivum]
MNLHYLTAHREVLECPVPKCRMKFINFECRENHRKKCELEKVACRHPSCTAGFKEVEEMEKHWIERHTTRHTTPERRQQGGSRSPSPMERVRFTCPLEEYTSSVIMRTALHAARRLVGKYLEITKSWKIICVRACRDTVIVGCVG